MTRRDLPGDLFVLPEETEEGLGVEVDGPAGQTGEGEDEEGLLQVVAHQRLVVTAVTLGTRDMDGDTE